MQMRGAIGALCLLVSSCQYMGGGSNTADEDFPITYYGTGDLPSEPPASCKFLERVEVTRLENKDPPMDKIEQQARDKVANAVAYIRRTGFKDGYLGKEYKFTASLYWCKLAKPIGSTTAAPSASAAP